MVSINTIIGLNLGSLSLGIAAWIMAAAGIRRTRQMLGLISHGLCGLSLVLQLCGIKLRTDMGDYSAIDDTIEGIIYCAAVLITVTVSLNIIALLRQRHQRNEV